MVSAIVTAIVLIIIMIRYSIDNTSSENRTSNIKEYNDKNDERFSICGIGDNSSNTGISYGANCVILTVIAVVIIIIAITPLFIINWLENDNNSDVSGEIAIVAAR